MSIDYDNYLKMHKACVSHGVMWLLHFGKLNDILPKINTQQLLENVAQHDASKYLPEEYAAYDDYFYGKKTKEVEEAFDYAWLHHLHCNPHHWQYWILKEDDSLASSDSMAIKCLEIPDVYILEMIADWWSFSWKNYLFSHDKDDLYEIFNWYNDHLDKICMHPASKKKVEQLLDLIRDILDNSNHVVELVK